jgi:hypothetical protein
MDIQVAEAHSKGGRAGAGGPDERRGKMKRLADARLFWVSSVLVLGACGATPLPDEARVTGLHFTTSSTFPDNPPPTTT